MCLFSFRKLFVTCSCCFFFFCLFRNGKREERWEGRPSRRCMVYIKYDNVHNHKASSKSEHHTFFIYSGVLKFKQSLKPQSKAHGFNKALHVAYESLTHFAWATIGFIEKLSVDCHYKGHIVRRHLYSNSLMVSSCNLTPQCRDLWSWTTTSVSGCLLKYASLWKKLCTDDLVLLAALEQFEYQAQHVQIGCYLLHCTYWKPEDSGTTQKEDVKKTLGNCKMLPSILSKHCRFCFVN